MVHVEVVIETIVGGRPDIQLRLRKEAENGGTQHMGGGMSDLLKGSHRRAGGHVVKSYPFARDSRGGGQGRRQAPYPSRLLKVVAVFAVKHRPAQRGQVLTELVGGGEILPLLGSPATGTELGDLDRNRGFGLSDKQD